MTESVGNNFDFEKLSNEKLKMLLNYLDYTFKVELDLSCDDKKIVRYFWENNLSGFLTFESKLIGIFKNDIEEKSLILVDAGVDKLIGHLIIDLKLNKEDLENLSLAIQIHATRKLKHHLKYF